MSIYDINVKKSDSTMQPLSDFSKKLLLIVNSATHCGFTPQYNELRELHESYAEKGLVILDFPCNQFGEQAKGTNEEIAEFCQLNFKTPYEMYAKVEVNGENQSELFRYLKEQKGFNGFNNDKHPLNEKLKEMFSESDPNYEQSDDIKWNFTKFLVGKDGEVLARFEPVDDAAVMKPVIEKYI